MSDWYVTDYPGESDFAVASKNGGVIAMIVGGDTLGEQADFAGRIASVPRLERELEAARRDANQWETQCKVARIQRDRLAEALRFYADISKYPAPLTGGMGVLYFDCGGRAAEALAAAKGAES